MCIFNTCIEEYCCKQNHWYHTRKLNLNCGLMFRLVSLWVTCKWLLYSYILAHTHPQCVQKLQCIFINVKKICFQVYRVILFKRLLYLTRNVIPSSAFINLHVHCTSWLYLPGVTKDLTCQISCFHWIYYWYVCRHDLEVKKKRKKCKILIIARPFVDMIKWRNQDIGSLNGRKKGGTQTHSTW